MPPIPKPKRTRRPNFLRQWRKFCGYTLTEVGAEIGMNGTNLGRIEKGEVPYSQDLLEVLAEFYGCEVSDLLIRNPEEPASIWTIWEQAKPAQREQIVRVAQALVDADGPPDNLPKPHDPQSPKQSQRKLARSRTAKAG